MKIGDTVWFDGWVNGKRAIVCGTIVYLKTLSSSKDVGKKITIIRTDNDRFTPFRFSEECFSTLEEATVNLRPQLI